VLETLTVSSVFPTLVTDLVAERVVVPGNLGVLVAVSAAGLLFPFLDTPDGIFLLTGDADTALALVSVRRVLLRELVASLAVGLLLLLVVRRGPPLGDSRTSAGTADTGSPVVYVDVVLCEEVSVSAEVAGLLRFTGQADALSARVEGGVLRGELVSVDTGQLEPTVGLGPGLGGIDLGAGLLILVPGLVLRYPVLLPQPVVALAVALGVGAVLAPFYG